MTRKEENKKYLCKPRHWLSPNITNPIFQF